MQAALFVSMCRRASLSGAATGRHTPTDSLGSCQAGTGDLLTETVTDATGNGTTFGPVDYATSTPGTYYWLATYSGKTFNNGFAGACGDEVTTIGQTNNTHGPLV